ncbi:MAG: translocation/assembly module TamB domain-containing protein, partial [Cyanobacteria bacterium P01_A01_bin.37]
DNLAFNAVEFNSALDGDLQFSLAEGGTIDLEGDGDRIFAQLDSRLLPTAFAIRNSNSVTDTTDPFTIEGQTQGETLTAEVRNFRLSELQFDPFPSQSIGRVRGVVNANIEANIADLSNPSVVGSVAIAQPAVGYIAAESFTGQLSYQSGRAALSQGELILGTSRYRLSAQANVLDANLPYQADLVIEEGHVQDILTALQFFNFDDLNRGLEAPQYQGRSALVTRPVGVDPDASLLDQLAIISAIVTQREEAIAQQENALIPSLEELSGMFEGRISATGSRQTGFLVDFGLRGDNWAWGKFNQPNTFAASGTITPQTLTVAPFRFESGETFINFDGQVGRTQQSGMLEVANVPVEIIQEFVALPVDLEGNIYANAQIGGTLDDPEVVGDIGLIDSRLNETPLERVDVDFTYDDARLIANGGIFITGQDGMTIAGNIPYALPFMSIQPASDQISASIDIQNEGLAFLTILSNGQAIWDGGQGDIDLKASGTLTQPLIQGAVTFEDGAISSPLLNDPITGITGTANFNLDRINIDQLNAQFNDGQITVQGMLPIFNALAADPNTPLTITFKDTPVSLRNLLAATVDGDVLITGAALAPVIGGNVNVSNGRVFALNLAGNTPTIPANDSPDAEPNPFLDQVQLEDFNISLSDSLQISGRPIFDIAAIGDLTLNGPLSDIKPDGTIQLTNGWINIVSTQFRLNRDADNTATFRPENGLDPDINVQLVARVQEVERTPIAPSSPFASAEVADQSTTPTFGGLQTVEVFATVDGLASKLSDNLELTSDPTRSDTQIVALLGGQTIDALQNGNVTGGVAAFVGSGFLAGFSNDLANTLGLSEFSIFPSTGDIGGESRLPLSIGIEVGFDITRDFSVSVLEILDGGSQPQFNFRYELTDQIRLRASTDLDEDSRAIIEFRSSF